MSDRIYGIRRWLQEDDQLLREMSASGKSLTLMTAKLKRPMNAIKSRAEELGVRIPGTAIGLRAKRRPPEPVD